MCNYTAGLMFQTVACKRLPLFNKTDIRNTAIQNLTARKVIPTLNDAAILRISFVSLIADVVERYIKETGGTIEHLGFAMPSCSPLDPKESRDIHTLPTEDLNEGVIKDMVDILRNIQETIGLSETQAKENILLFYGDYLTVRNIRYGQGLLRLTY